MTGGPGSPGTPDLDLEGIKQRAAEISAFYADWHSRAPLRGLADIAALLNDNRALVDRYSELLRENEQLRAAVIAVLDRNSAAAAASHVHYGAPTDYESGCYETLAALDRQIRAALNASEVSDVG